MQELLKCVRFSFCASLLNNPKKIVPATKTHPRICTHMCTYMSLISYSQQSCVCFPLDPNYLHSRQPTIFLLVVKGVVTYYTGTWTHWVIEPSLFPSPFSGLLPIRPIEHATQREPRCLSSSQATRRVGPRGCSLDPNWVAIVI